MGQVIDFLGLIWTVDHELQTLSKRMLNTLGVTGPQRLLLRIAARFPGLPASEIASVMRLDRSTISGILKRLEGRDLIERRQDLRDGRRTLVVLTAKGRELALDPSGTVEGVVERVLSEMTTPEIAATRTALARLASALAKESTAEGTTGAIKIPMGKARRTGDR